MMRTRLIHISDLHLTADLQPIWNIDTFSHFKRSLKSIANISEIDAILVSGDIANDGCCYTYHYTDKAFRDLNIPTYWCPGNHDSLSVLKDFSKNSFCKILDSTNINGIRFLFLNTVAIDDDNPLYNRARGILSSDELTTFDTKLSEIKEPCVVVMHHPSIGLGCWLTDKMLKQSHEFNEIIMKYSNVKLVLSGHIHYHSVNKVNNTIFSTASSIGYAFKRELPQYQRSNGEEGFSLIDITSKEINIKKINI